MAKSDETAKSGASAPRPREEWHDAWIGRLVAEPATIPDVTVITGFVGAATEPDFVRVYLDPQLQQCMEIPVDAIVHREEIPKANSPLGGSYLWVQRAAQSRFKSFMRQC